MLKLALHIVRPALQKEQDSVDHRTVVLRCHLPHAGCKAALDMILQAGALGHRTARAHRKKALQELQAVP